MQPHQQRVVDEKSELDEKLSNLNKFFSNSIFLGLNKDEQNRLKLQAIYMQKYLDILKERIENF